MSDSDLRADCAACLALCCTAFAFCRADGFGHDKAAGTPCHFLTPHQSCRIHPQRETLGYDTCIDFDCKGAGQRATRQFPNQTDPRATRLRFQRFAQLLPIQEMKAALTEAGQLCLNPILEAQRNSALERLAEISDQNGLSHQAEVEVAMEDAKRVVDEIRLRQ